MRMRPCPSPSDRGRRRRGLFSHCAPCRWLRAPRSGSPQRQAWRRPRSPRQLSQLSERAPRAPRTCPRGLDTKNGYCEYERNRRELKYLYESYLGAIPQLNRQRASRAEAMHMDFKSWWSDGIVRRNGTRFVKRRTVPRAGVFDCAVSDQKQCRGLRAHRRRERPAQGGGKRFKRSEPGVREGVVALSPPPSSAPQAAWHIEANGDAPPKDLRWSRGAANRRARHLHTPCYRLQNRRAVR